MRKIKTTKLTGGGEYAHVADRLKQFREDCPNGLIETEPSIQEDGTIIFKVRVLKDKSNPNSAEATGHSMGKSAAVKAFEKLETVALGRALALLGYLAGGEIASSEEMEQFLEYRNDQIDTAIEQLNKTDSIDSLKAVFMSLGTLMAEEKVIEAKDKRKAELNEDSTPNS